MSATEELRRLLDARGIGHTDAEDGHTQHTWWRCGDHEVTACASGHRLNVYNLTPAQAIVATLGRGTCRMTLRDDIRGHAYQDTYECSECGEYVIRETYMGESEPPRFCPSCGRKVIP